MTTIHRVLALSALSLSLAGPALAGTVSFDLVATTSLTNVDDAAGRYQYHGGDIFLNGNDIGDWFSTKRVVFGATTTNEAPIEIVLLVQGRTSPSQNVTLKGLHSFNTGDAKGGVAAASASYPFLAGGTFELSYVSTGQYGLTLGW